MRLKDKVAIVTGAGKGIGRAIAEAYAREGAKVAVATRSPQPGQETVEHITQAGGEAFLIQADVGRDEDIERMVQQTLERWGKIDILVNNAGVAEGTAWFNLKTITDLPVEDFDRVMRVDLRAVFLASRLVISGMIENGGGVIINVASVAGTRAYMSGPAYAAAKHGVLGLTKMMAVIDGPNGIRINAINPGAIDTPMMARTIANKDSMSWQRVRQAPARRYGLAEECAGAAVFLASDEAGFIHGTSIVVDGGISL